MPDAPTIWGQRAKALLEYAAEACVEIDVIAEVSAALMCLRIEQGEADPSEMDGYPFDDIGRDAECCCSPSQLATGGFAGRCPVHSARGGWGAKVKVARRAPDEGGYSPDSPGRDEMRGERTE